MTLLTFARDETERALFAVVVDSGKVTYVWPKGAEPWFSDDRPAELAAALEVQPEDDETWMQVATTHLGPEVTTDVPDDGLSGDAEAIQAARDYLDGQPPEGVPSSLLDQASDNYDQVASDYPGFMEDEENIDDAALTNLVLMNLGPIDPEGPNGWVLRAQDGEPREGDENGYLHWPGVVESTGEDVAK